MKFLAINEYLQTLATLGAMVGLLTIAYEIQQSNRVTLSENAAGNWSQWMSTPTALIESDIAATRAKAITSRHNKNGYFCRDRQSVPLNVGESLCLLDGDDIR